MPKEDMLIRQINQLGFVLKRMIEMLTGGSDSGIDLSETMTAVEVKVKEELDFDIKTILGIPSENIVEFLLKNQSFNPENLELFAIFLESLANRIDADKTNFYEKALQVYLYIDKKTATFSFERSTKIGMIKKSLL
jgi:predicted hydrocarbon binding protein